MEATRTVDKLKKTRTNVLKLATSILFFNFIDS